MSQEQTKFPELREPERQPEWYEEDEYDDEWHECLCNGSGMYVTCIDDMCHGLGYCIHGDGMSACPNPECSP